jgi:hypothetical protein
MKMAEYSKEYMEIVKNFRDAISINKTERVPNISNFFTWKILDSDIPFKEALYDYEKMEKIVCDFHERYNFDAYMDLGTRNPISVTDALGGGFYSFDEKTGGINMTDHILMSGEEYPDYVKNPVEFQKLLFQRKWPDMTTDQFIGGFSEFMNFGKYAGDMVAKFAHEYSRPTVFDMSGAILVPYEFFNSVGRGIKELSLDCRRHKNELREALDAYFTTFTIPSLDVALASDTSMYVTDTYTALLGYSMMSVKQFEAFYWPHLKIFIDKVIEADKTIYIFCESSMLRFAEFFQDFKKGHIVMHLEVDDPAEIRRLLPNICIAGGITTNVLGYGTPQECIDQAKKIIDDVGDGLILSQDKMVSFKNDCSRENLLALNEFIRNYRV